MHLQLPQDLLVNIKTGKALLLKLTKEKYVLLKQFLHKEHRLQLKEIKQNCSVIAITTDKVYKNKEWIYGYRENDELGVHDPYSASKAACEIAISSWRESFVHNDKNNEIIEYKNLSLINN